MGCRHPEQWLNPQCHNPPMVRRNPESPPKRAFMGGNKLLKAAQGLVNTQSQMPLLTVHQMPSAAPQQRFRPALLLPEESVAGCKASARLCQALGVCSGQVTSPGGGCDLPYADGQSGMATASPPWGPHRLHKKRPRARKSLIGCEHHRAQAHTCTPKLSASCGVIPEGRGSPH